MPEIAILLVLFLVVLIFVLPIAAMVKASGASRRCEEAHQRMQGMQEDLRRMETEMQTLREALLGSTTAAPAAPSPAKVAGPAPAPSSTTESVAARSPATAAPPPLVNVPPPSAPPAVISVRPVVPALVSPPRADTPSPVFAEAKQEKVVGLERKPALPAFDWEQFLGLKLAAWLGGLVLALGVVFGLKYSFEHELIKPPMRVALGVLFGLSLLLGGLRLPRPRYVVTTQVFCAAGVLVLYADVFAACSFYHLIPSGAAFLFMVLVTVTAFALAVWLDAPVVAVLGLLGGFLTPPLLSTGEDNPLGLFGYIALLDAGLVAVTLRKRWGYLVLLGALGTLAMEWGWLNKFFEADKIYTAMAVFAGFAWFFLAAFGLDQRKTALDKNVAAAALILPASAFVFAFYLIDKPYPEVMARPGLLFSYLFVVDLGLLGMVWLRDELRVVQGVAGLAMFGMLMTWSARHLSAGLLNWALGGYLVFGLGHTVYPLVLERLRPRAGSKDWIQVFPVLALGLILLPMNQLAAVSLAIWPVVLLVDLLAVVVACVTLSLVSLVGVLLLTMATLGSWVLKIPAASTEASSLLLLLAAFAGFFFVASLWVFRKYFGGSLAQRSPAAGGPGTTGSAGGNAAWLADQIPALAALMPFLLLVMVIFNLSLANPSPVFGLAALMLALLLGLLYYGWPEMLGAVALVCVLLVEYAWHGQRETPGFAPVTLGWYLGFYAVFHAYPFVFGRRMKDRNLTYIVSALSGPAHFYLVYQLVKTTYVPAYPGLVPLAFALPYLGSLAALLRQEPSAPRLTRLAWHGGVALFFITLIFPIQFDRQWLTIGWALEGTALLWLFQRVPHPGLPRVGAALLVTAFARLALNPAIFHYYPRSNVAIWNWFLYAYGLVTLCLFAGALLMAPPRHLLQGVNAPPILRGLGTVLAFLLMNIEIADKFSQGSFIAFEFTGSFERDLAYSLAWAAFAFVLLVAGIQRRVAAARYAGIGLLSVTVLKLFFHDLWRLGGLYRIGSLFGLAVVLILVSVLYQRFMAGNAGPRTPPEPTAPGAPPPAEGER